MLKIIRGYENFYWVHSTGRIYSCRKRRYVFGAFTRLGYLKITLTKDGRKKTHLIHRIVASAFIKNPNRKPQVNHKNGIKHHNNARNLEWATVSENTAHAYRTGLKKPLSGSNHPSAKLVESDIKNIIKMNRLGKFSQRKIGEMYGISNQQVSRIINRKRWAHT